MFVLVAHFTEPAPSRALELLAVQPSCLRLVFGRSTDVSHRYVLVADFADPAGYRAALSPFEVRTCVIPWLSTSLPGSGVHEALVTAVDGVVSEHQPTVTPGR
jgi:hypothetical protein